MTIGDTVTDPLVPTEVPHWAETPTLVKAAIVDPNGTVNGHVNIAFTDSSTAFVSTTDSAQVDYRGYVFTVSMHLYRNDDGTWTHRTPEPHVQYRYPIRPAPRTYRAAIMNAVMHTVGHYWNPELDQQAQYAHAVHRLHTLARERDHLRAELARVEAERAPHLATVHLALAPRSNEQETTQ
jgi:hypothetical protein